MVFIELNIISDILSAVMPSFYILSDMMSHVIILSAVMLLVVTPENAMQHDLQAFEGL
jgi:hypothetical protein